LFSPLHMNSLTDPKVHTVITHTKGFKLESGTSAHRDHTHTQGFKLESGTSQSTTTK
jgi:hypothetical protein